MINNKGEVYRFLTGVMYDATYKILPDGREACFGVYKKVDDSYQFIGKYTTPTEVLEQRIINGKLLRDNRRLDY